MTKSTEPKKKNEQTGNHNSQVEKLIKEHQPRLKSFIRKRVPNKEDAEDILQDVFFQLINAVEDTFNPIEQITAWLYRVTRNIIINKGKKKHEDELPVYPSDEDGDVLKEFSEVLFNDVQATPETEYLRSLVWQELDAALSELPVEQREIFELTELDGLPVKEIAENTGVPVNTLLSRKHYAIRHLRKRLEVLYNEMLYY